MEFLRAQFARIQQQLAGLSASQRMLAGTLVVIIAMTIAWWANYAGKAEMEPVLDQTMAADDIAVITTRLASKGISYKVVGDRILVPIEKKMEVLADLGYAQMLPRDTKSAFDEIIAKSSPFASSRQQTEMWNQAKQATLAQIIRQFPRVAHAMVLVDPTRERGPGGTEPSATVNITMRSGEAPDAKIVNAAADLVAGAVANLSRSRVRVIIDGASFTVHDRDDIAGGGTDERLALVQKAERYYRDKVIHQFAWIEGAMVEVNVRLNASRKETTEHKVDPKNVLQKAVSEDNNTDETRSASKDTPEAGVVPNAGMQLGEGGGGGQTSSGTTDRTRTEFYVDAGHSDIKSIDPGGDLSVVGASLLIPRSHFVQAYKKRTNITDREPDATVLDAFINDQLTRMRPAVKACLGLAVDEAVHVDSYTDLMPQVAAAPQAAATSVSLAVTDHVKEIVIGALALLSLLMVSNMVRKATPAPSIPIVEPVAPPPVLRAGDDAVGEASEGGAMLDGMEVDEESVKAQQMLNQVSEMVEANPDAAASLVKRWLNRS